MSSRRNLASDRPERFYGALETTFETAGTDSGGRLRIRGVANSMGIMRSRRMFLPGAFDRQVGSGRAIDLPLMVNHGQVDGLASIGRVDRLEMRKGEGLRFEAWIAQGTRNADEARQLAQQGAIKTVSVGWISKADRIIGRNDRDLPKPLADLMDAEGVRHVHAFADVELFEISLVDVPDDPGAKLAARDGRGGAVERALATLSERVQSLETRIELLGLAGGHADIAALAGDMHALLESKLAEIKAYLADLAAPVERDSIKQAAAEAAGRELPGCGDSGDAELEALAGIVAQIGGEAR